jgi:hypothetical protein
VGVNSDLQGGIELLNGALWNGILQPGQAYLPRNFRTIKAAAKKLLKLSTEDERLRPLRKPAKGGPGPLDGKQIESLIAAWERALPRYIGELVERREAVEFQIPGGKKVERGYALTDAGALAGAIRDRSAHFERTVADLRRQVQELGEIMAGLGATAAAGPRPPSGPAAGDELIRRLHEVYRQLDATGRGYVPIHSLRAAVDCPREEFDRTLARLRRDLVVDLQVGSSSDYRADEIIASLRDPDGTLYLTLTWRR